MIRAEKLVKKYGEKTVIDGLSFEITDGEKIVISGDRETSYGQVIELMSLLRLAGISKVGLKTGDMVDAGILNKKTETKKK